MDSNHGIIPQTSDKQPVVVFNYDLHYPLSHGNIPALKSCSCYWFVSNPLFLFSFKDQYGLVRWENTCSSCLCFNVLFTEISDLLNCFLSLPWLIVAQSLVRYVMRRVDIVHKSHSAAEPFTWVMCAPYVMIVDCVPRAEFKKCWVILVAKRFKKLGISRLLFYQIKWAGSIRWPNGDSLTE